ncbi:Asp23/Gls24 family envelope stress response protein [Arthrobacter sp. 4R501]|uniref:Asp23/Gls24 family envelope stress response protein n=1 Tax=Arthrobacter sp. 4R501 TaxID=2058886 RepID=UPI000CE2BF31|nr:Asp23/Gls24 family envelope stress response protein [Arthrobacter sp. 4R501]
MEYQNPQPDAGVERQHATSQPATSHHAASQAPVPGHGRTVIAETAVAKVAGIAARAVPGVYSLGSAPSRALGAIRDAVGSSDHAAGVRAEVGETQVAVDISLVASYGSPLHSLADQVRAAVYRAVEELVGLQVIEVNVEITDVYVAPPVKAGAPAVAVAEREALL